MKPIFHYHSFESLLPLLFVAVSVTASPVVGGGGVVAARQPQSKDIDRNNSPSSPSPALRGGFISSCDFYQVISHGEAYGHLQAQCNLDPGNPATEMASTLDLSLCMGNYNHHLAWGYLGGAFASCKGCKSRTFATRYLDCDCGSVDLNDGIYVTSEGAVACYDQVGSSYPVPHPTKE